MATSLTDYTHKESVSMVEVERDDGQAVKRVRGCHRTVDGDNFTHIEYVTEIGVED